MKSILQINSQIIQSGIWKTAKASGVLWEEGSNVVFRDLGFRRIDGASQVGELLSDQARDIAQAYVNNARRIFLGTDTAIELREFLAGSWTSTMLTGWATAGQTADLETWGSWLVASNGRDPLLVWKDGTLETLVGTPFSRAKVILRKQPFLLAFNTDNIGDTAVEWSSDSDIEDWTPTTINKAGNISLRDLDSEIIAAEHMGDRVAVYSRSGLVLGQFVGGANVWSWRRAIHGVGAVSRRSVVTLDPYNYGFSRDGIFKTDGNSFLYVDDPAMLRYIRDNADFSQEHLFWGIADSALKMVSFYFRTADNLWKSVSYYPDAGMFTKGDLQLTAGARKEVFNFPIVASEDRKVGFWQETEKYFGTDVSYNLKTRPIDFGTSDMYKIHNLTRVDGQWVEANLRVRVHEHPEDPGVICYDAPLQGENYFSRDGKYFSWEFYGSKPLYVVGMEVFGIGGGVGR
jgi:hypothetical protein